MTKPKSKGKCICISIAADNLHLLDMIDQNRLSNKKVENRSQYLLRLVVEDNDRIQKEKFAWLKDF